MRRSLPIALVCLASATTFCQSPKIARSPGDAEALLTKTRALYDTPFASGLISFSCAVDFDFAQHLKTNFGESAQADSPLAKLLIPIRYRIFVDHSGATVSAQPKLPDFSQLPSAGKVEEANRTLIQTGLTNWVPYAYGEVLPISPTSYQFTRTATGYNLAMDGKGIKGNLILDQDLHLISGVVDTSQHIEITTSFIPSPNGLILAASSTDTDHSGLVRFTYTYETVDGFRLPQRVSLSSANNALNLSYTLTDCKTQHGIVVRVTPPPKE